MPLFMVSAICDKKKERWGKLDCFDGAFNALPLVYQSIRKLEKHLREDLIMFLSLRIKPQVSPSNLIKKNLSRQNLTSLKNWKSGGKLTFVKRTKRKIPVLFGWNVLKWVFCWNIDCNWLKIQIDCLEYWQLAELPGVAWDVF